MQVLASTDVIRCELHKENLLCCCGTDSDDPMSREGGPGSAVLGEPHSFPRKKFEEKKNDVTKLFANDVTKLFAV